VTKHYRPSVAKSTASRMSSGIEPQHGSARKSDAGFAEIVCTLYARLTSRQQLHPVSVEVQNPCGFIPKWTVLTALHIWYPAVGSSNLPPSPRESKLLPGSCSLAHYTA